MTRWIRLGWLALPALAGCGGGSAGTVAVVSTAPTATATSTPTPTPTATSTPTPTPTPTPTATPTGFAAQAAALYDVQPDPASCSPGTLKASVKAEFLARLNAVRALHNLPAVTYSTSEDGDEQASSLMMATNRALSHTPPTTWTCYSQSGATGAGASNLIGGWGTGLPFNSEDDNVAGWLNEGGGASLGHRRWILDPFLGKTSYGRVTYVDATGYRASTASMRVFTFAGGVATPTGVPGFVALPYGDYPVRYFRTGDYLSFTVVANTAGTYGSNGNVSFKGATITVTGPAGALTVTDVASDNDGYGVPNAIEWRVTGLQAGVSYTVTISGITGAPQSSYSYGFRIVS